MQYFSTVRHKSTDALDKREVLLRVCEIVGDNVAPYSLHQGGYYVQIVLTEISRESVP